MGVLEFLDPPFDQRAEPSRHGRELLKCLVDMMPFVGIIQVADWPCDLRQFPCPRLQGLQPLQLATCPVEADDTDLLREALEAVVEGVAESKQEKCRRSLDLIGEDRPGSGEDASLAWPERFPHDCVGDRRHQRGCVRPR